MSVKSAGYFLIGLASLLLGLALTAAPGYARRSSQASEVITIPAGQTATVHVTGFCIDPGKPFPSGVNLPASLASDAVRAGLYYAAAKGYTSSDPAQVQEAVWYLQTGAWQKADHALGQEIVNAASDPANKPADPAGATSLLDALNNGSVSATLSFAPAPGSAPGLAYYGMGELQVKNNGAQQVQVFMPFGAVLPPTDASDQRLVVYASGVQQAPTLTAAPTDTVAPTNTAAPATSTAAPTNTAVPATSAPLATATPTLPQTGAPQDAGWLALLGGGLLALLSGMVLLLTVKPTRAE